MALQFRAASIAVGIVTFGYLLLISANRLLWIDEAAPIIYSFATPLAELLKGNTGEVNVAPGYFVALKVLLKFQPLVTHLTGFHPVHFVRLLAIIPACFATAYIFDFAKAKFGILLALSIAIAFAGGYQFQEYGFQARQYGPWICFSVIFTKMLFDEAMRPNQKPNRVKLFLSMLFLCLTTPIGLIQVAAGGLFLTLCRCSMKKLFEYALLFLPTALYLTYCRSNGTIAYFIWPGVLELRPYIMANAKWWMLAGMLVLFYALRSRNKNAARAVSAFSLSLVVVVVILVAQVWVNRQRPAWFPVVNRYFLFLYPQLLVALVCGATFLPKNVIDNKKLKYLVATFLLAVGLNPAITKFSKTAFPLYTTVVFNDIAPFLEKAGGRCVCVDRNAVKTSYEKWTHYLLAIRAHNFGKTSCDNPVHLYFDQPTGEAHRAFIGIVEPQNQRGTFSFASSFCI